MSALLEGVNRRTQLVGQNRLELLLFRIKGKQQFGINVFKVREVVACPALTRVPHSHALIRGVARLRGQTLPIIDLDRALGGAGIAETDVTFVIVTEFNSSVQGFLVTAVDSIVNVNWEDMKPPPRGIERGSYMTAITQIGDSLVEVVDVERVLAQVRGLQAEVSASFAASEGVDERAILVVDDSSVARNQIQRALNSVGLDCVLMRNGREALETLQGWAAEGPVGERIAMVISDIEMPEKDGYTLTQDIRRDPHLADLYVLLHSSLSGVFNEEMVTQAGANRFLSKFHPDDLVQAVLDQVRG